MVLAKVDTGASLSLLYGDMARDVFKQKGKPFHMARCNIPLITLSGDRMEVKGTAEFVVQEVGQKLSSDGTSFTGIGWCYAKTGVLKW